MLSRMSDRGRDAARHKDHGPRLAAYLRSMLAPGQSMRSFCLEHGLDNARVSAWESSPGDVSIDRMRELGDALGLTLGQVMVIAGYGAPDDFGGAAPPPPAAPPVSIDLAIDRDPDLPDYGRRMLRELLASIRAIDAGAAERVEHKPTRKPRRGRS